MFSWFVSQQGSNCRYTVLPSFSLTFRNNPDLIVIELKSIFTWKALQHSSAILCGLILITTWGHPVWWHWTAQTVLVCESTSWSWARETIASIWARECIKTMQYIIHSDPFTHCSTLLALLHCSVPILQDVQMCCAGATEALDPWWMPAGGWLSMVMWSDSQTFWIQHRHSWPDVFDFEKK